MNMNIKIKFCGYTQIGIRVTVHRFKLYGTEVIIINFLVYFSQSLIECLTDWSGSAEIEIHRFLRLLLLLFFSFFSDHIINLKLFCVYFMV